MRSTGYSPDELTIFLRDRSRMAGKTIIAALLLGVCFLGFWGQVGTGKISPAKELLLWIAFGTGAVMLVAGVFKIFDFRPAVEVSTRGLLARDISPDLIPWNGIVEVSIREFKRTQMIEVQILPGTLRSIRLTKDMRWEISSTECWDFRITISLPASSIMMPTTSSPVSGIKSVLRQRPTSPLIAAHPKCNKPPR